MFFRRIIKKRKLVMAQNVNLRLLICVLCCCQLSSLVNCKEVFLDNLARLRRGTIAQQVKDSDHASLPSSSEVASLIDAAPIVTLLRNTNYAKDISESSRRYFSPVDLHATSISESGFMLPRTRNIREMFEHPESDFDNSTTDCLDSTCVRKCCAEGLIFSLVGKIGCVTPGLNESLLEFEFQLKDFRAAQPKRNVLRIIGMPSKCSLYGQLPEHRRGTLLPDGRFFTSYDKRYRDYDEYCQEIFRKSYENVTVAIKNTVVCISPYVPSTREVMRRYVHSTCLSLSVLALALLIVCHLCIPELRNLQGLCLLSHACCLLLGSTLLFITHVWNSIPHMPCVIIGLLLHISYVAAYTWLAVMCFDIWKYVRMSIKMVPWSSRKERRIFLKYSAVAWSTVLGIFLITATLQFLPQDSLPQGVIRPAIGVTRCFIIEEDANLFVYFFFILGFLCFLNLTLVVWTIVYLKQGGATIWCWSKKSFHPESSVFNANNVNLFWQRFQIFALTIFLWTTEVLSWKIPPDELWDVTDVLNTLQGVIILLIFIRQPDKRRHVTSLFKKLLNTKYDTSRGTSTSSGRGIISSTMTTSMTSVDKSLDETVKPVSKKVAPSQLVTKQSINEPQS